MKCPVLVLILLVSTGVAFAQTESARISGRVTDLSGAVIVGAECKITNIETNVSTATTTNQDGIYVIPDLRPAIYRLTIQKEGLRTVVRPNLQLYVQDAVNENFTLALGPMSESVTVFGAPSMLQTESAALGRVVNQTAVSNLPLVTRNFTQIVSLSPGVTTGVNNAGELGLGGGGLSQIDQSNDGIFVHGARSYDNNFQIDGLSVSDVQGTAAASGGVPIPNPDAIQEFKVQTALYDASYGRYAGANISMITRTGSNAYHGDMFEFLRNDVLNANDFFTNQTGQPRPSLKQNQFGFDIGGPVRKDKVFFFGSYQGTRQVNGIAAGQARTGCTTSLSTPPLTNDRSRAALGMLFAGMTGALGGTAVKSDGSNINPVAMALLNFKLPDGTFLIPTPQTLDPTKPFAAQGVSFLSQPCHFDEDQFLTNVDYVGSQTSRIAARFFFSDDNQLVTFPGNAIDMVGNIPGFGGASNSGPRVLSLSHTYTPSSWLNETRIGYVRLRTSTVSEAPFKWSDIGVAEGEMNEENALPSLNILGSASLASAFPRTITQNSFVLIDNVGFVHGNHMLRFGGSVTRVQDNLNIVGLGSFLQFLSWPDFMLGLDATDNRTGTFSNVFASADDFGLLDREYRAWEGSVFGQDDYRIGKSLTLNLGLRYERLGQFGDTLGRNSTFDITKADPNPPAEGTVAGYVVASTIRGQIPPGVTRASNPFATNAVGQNSWAPRLGFSWRIFPRLSSFLLRGGYGIYFSRPTGQSFSVTALAPPFSVVRQEIGIADAAATFQTPFPQPFPTAASFPQFPAYSPTTEVPVTTVSPDFRPSVIQQFGLNIQAELHANWLLEVGYVGTRGTHLLRTRSVNQALGASTADPIRGQTTDTVANIPLRVPIQGVPSELLTATESEGDSWYNGLEGSLTKRLGHGLQFLASYTFSKTLDTDGANINGTSAGNTDTLGDQNSPRQRWGRASFDRTHRFVFSATYSLPAPEKGPVKRSLFGGWALASVITVQSGTALTVSYTNATNVFGITGDRAQLAAGCTKGQLMTPGSVDSKLNDYFNSACFTTPPVIGADGLGTAFGDSRTGMVNGPGQANVDFALSKTMGLAWPREGSALLFRVEFFNALNHPQFANPDTQFGSSTFGVISTTAVNPRIGQLAIKFSF
jgi:Carboxypeptidase regulatory-like domain/TonB dependent receptor